MSQLKLNENQAQGGIGSLLSIAQTALGDSKFKAIEDSIPGAQQLMQAAPAFDTKSGLGGLISQAAGSTDLGKGLQGSAMLYTAFEKLGYFGLEPQPLAPLAHPVLFWHFLLVFYAPL